MPISSPSSVTVQRRMSLLTVNRSVSASDGIKSAAPVPRKVIFIDLSRFLRSPVCDTPVFPAKNAAEAHSGSCCASPALFHCSTIPEKMRKCFCHPDFRRAPRVHSPEAPEEVSVGHFQHTGHHAALHAAGDHHAPQRASSRGIHQHPKFRVFIVLFAAEAPRDGRRHSLEHDFHDKAVVLHFHDGIVHGERALFQHRGTYFRPSIASQSLWLGFPPQLRRSRRARGKISLSSRCRWPPARLFRAVCR